MSFDLNTYISVLQKALTKGDATEHTHRPALKQLLESGPKGLTATNEPKRVECGAPDFVISKDTARLTIGYVECKDVGKSLDEAERSEQLKRYRRSLPNLLLADYLEFRWYVDGEKRKTVRLGYKTARGKINPETNGKEELESLLTAFIDAGPVKVGRAKELAERMARLTHMMRDIIIEAFKIGGESRTLKDLRSAFAKTILPDLEKKSKIPEFADMYAQTIAYGLFAARINHDMNKGPFVRLGAAREIPKTNPFLRDLFETITGTALDDEPYAGFVDDLAALLNNADMHAVLEDFGKRNKRTDPVVHFYETFLAAYDPKLREQRGVYYTPEPVVSYIVRSVDWLLKEKFGCKDGLADTTKIKYTPPGDKSGSAEKEAHKVLILDPACGTGSFLYQVVDLIRERFMETGQGGKWSGYVRDHLLPRLFGFELLMAPYAVAHFKLAMQLAGMDLSFSIRQKWSYDFKDKERLGVFLTNTLEDPNEEIPTFFGPLRIITEEMLAANKIKKELPILAILGNPPYSVSSSNKGKYIEGLMETYKEAVRNETNIQPLSDDYIKFIRFAQQKIHDTGCGIIGFITNHSWVNGLLHRGMRHEIIKGFDYIYILDLHGNALTREKPPAGIEKDQNVFSIKQGVAISIFVKKTKEKRKRADLYFSEIWGSQKDKYDFLLSNDISTMSWTRLKPIQPQFQFTPVDITGHKEWEFYPSLINILQKYSTGFETGRDKTLVSFEAKDIVEISKRLADKTINNETIEEKYSIRDTSGWPVTRRRNLLIKEGFNINFIRCVCYRPFDQRFTFFHAFIRRAQLQNMKHLCQSNLGLITSRIIKGEIPNHCFVCAGPTEKIFLSPKTSNNAYIFPLYSYLKGEMYFKQEEINDTPWKSKHDRVPNFNPKFILDFEKRIGLTFVSDNAGDITSSFGPENFLHYIYAIFHSPAYRTRYAEFLKRDFPHVPLTSSKPLFRYLCKLGSELIKYHLLEHPDLSSHHVKFPESNGNTVAKGHPKYLAPGREAPGAEKKLTGGRVYINKEQYFEGITPEVWEFYVGGYQVCEKWLKDRRGRTLTYDEIETYQKIIKALGETIKLMKQIDEAIAEHGGWPIK